MEERHDFSDRVHCLLPWNENLPSGGNQGCRSKSVGGAAQCGLILLEKNLANNGRFLNNMTSPYDGFYAAFKIRFQ